MSGEHFSMILDVWPIIRNCLGYSDQRLVEFASVCVIRVIDSYHRSSVDNLEKLVDQDLVRAVNMLLIPSGGSPLIAPNTFTLLLRAMATAARASPKIAVVLLEADIVDTLYQILTGVLPGYKDEQEQGDAEGGQGLGGGLADLAVMDNLAHRPKDQIEEALSLVSELMPPVPKGNNNFTRYAHTLTRFIDGVFDHKSYTEKGLARLIKAKAKADRAAARQAQSSGSAGASTIAPSAQTPEQTTQSTDDAGARETPTAESQPPDAEEVHPEIPAPQATVDRTELLRSKPAVVGRFMQLLVPVLVDVYAASVITPVRVKTLTGLLKAVSFLEADGLKRVLQVRLLNTRLGIF